MSCETFSMILTASSISLAVRRRFAVILTLGRGHLRSLSSRYEATTMQIPFASHAFVSSCSSSFSATRDFCSRRYRCFTGDSGWPRTVSLDSFSSCLETARDQMSCWTVCTARRNLNPLLQFLGRLPNLLEDLRVALEPVKGSDAGLRQQRRQTGGKTVACCRKQKRLMRKEIKTKCDYDRPHCLIAIPFAYAPEPDSRWWSTMKCEPAQKPPIEPMAHSRPALIKSISRG